MMGRKAGVIDIYNVFVTYIVHLFYLFYTIHFFPPTLNLSPARRHCNATVFMSVSTSSFAQVSSTLFPKPTLSLIPSFTGSPSGSSSKRRDMSDWVESTEARDERTEDWEREDIRVVRFGIVWMKEVGYWAQGAKRRVEERLLVTDIYSLAPPAPLPLPPQPSEWVSSKCVNSLHLRNGVSDCTPYQPTSRILAMEKHPFYQASSER